MLFLVNFENDTKAEKFLWKFETQAQIIDNKQNSEFQKICKNSYETA